MAQGILAVNAGSSSLKFSIHPYEENGMGAALLSGVIEGLEPGGSPCMGWRWQGQSAHSEALTPTGPPFASALAHLRNWLGQQPGLPTLTAIAHRVVHGGERYAHSIVVTEPALAYLQTLCPLAPLHQPHNLAGIRAFTQAFAQLPQVACFDTAFHTTLPPEARTFALPRELTAQGVRRYGFHGLSYQYVMGQLLAHSPQAQGRVLMAHLGNGASLCAALDGKSIATSMGFSALDGLMMGTRSGTLDAGVLLYLMEQGWGHDRIQTLLYKQSGLLGVSGVSADMRTLRSAAQSGNAAAQEAIDLFTHRVLRECGAMAACLQGLDVLAFTGGIGQHDAQLRQQVCDALTWLGVSIDAQANAQARSDTLVALHTPDSRVQVWLAPTDEGRVAAAEAAALIGS